MRPPAASVGAGSAAALVAVLLALVAATPALAKYTGTDVFANVAPPSQSGGALGPHPSSYFALDTHVDAGITNPGGYVELIPHFLASQLWDVTRFLVLTTISLFSWAFSLDLLNGNGPGQGALGAVARAIHSVYAHTFGQSWLVVGILAAGLWGIWKGLVQRRIAEAAGQLALSFAFVVAALFLVYSPRQTIGRASEWTNELSLAFLGSATAGDLHGGSDAKSAVSQRLFHSLVYEPWVVLDFGGLHHCVGSDHNPVSPFAADRRLCIDHLREQNGRGGYAERFLRYAPGSGPRNAEYEALRDGNLPAALGFAGSSPYVPGLPPLPDPFGAGGGATPAPGQFDGFHVNQDDRPAVDIQQAGGGFQRLTMAALIFAGDLGAVFLLGSLSLAVILAQVFALLFLSFAPVALVAGVFPGRGHALFRGWILRLAGALVRKAAYSLVLAVVVSVAGALFAVTDSLGWLYAFGLQAAFYWGVFLRRHAVTAWLSGESSERTRSPLPRPSRVLQTIRRATAPVRSRRERLPAGPPEPPGPAEREAPTAGRPPPGEPERAPERVTKRPARAGAERPTGQAESSSGQAANTDRSRQTSSGVAPRDAGVPPAPKRHAQNPTEPSRSRGQDDGPAGARDEPTRPRPRRPET
jgi:hypothetical protein